MNIHDYGPQYQIKYREYSRGRIERHYVPKSQIKTLSQLILLFPPYRDLDYVYVTETLYDEHIKCIIAYDGWRPEDIMVRELD